MIVTITPSSELALARTRGARAPRCPSPLPRLPQFPREGEGFTRLFVDNKKCSYISKTCLFSLLRTHAHVTKKLHINKNAFEREHSYRSETTERENDNVNNDNDDDDDDDNNNNNSNDE